MLLFLFSLWNPFLFIKLDQPPKTKPECTNVPTHPDLKTQLLWENSWFFIIVPLWKTELLQNANSMTLWKAKLHLPVSMCFRSKNHWRMPGMNFTKCLLHNSLSRCSWSIRAAWDWKQWNLVGKKQFLNTLFFAVAAQAENWDEWQQSMKKSPSACSTHLPQLQGHVEGKVNNPPAWETHVA